MQGNLRNVNLLVSAKALCGLNFMARCGNRSTLYPRGVDVGLNVALAIFLAFLS